MFEWFDRVGYSATSPAWNGSPAASSQNSPTGHAATRDQMGAEKRGPKEKSHESCQIVGIRRAVVVD